MRNDQAFKDPGFKAGRPQNYSNYVELMSTCSELCPSSQIGTEMNEPPQEALTDAHSSPFFNTSPSMEEDDGPFYPKISRSSAFHQLKFDEAKDTFEEREERSEEKIEEATSQTQCKASDQKTLKTELPSPMKISIKRRQLEAEKKFCKPKDPSVLTRLNSDSLVFLKKMHMLFISKRLNRDTFFDSLRSKKDVEASIELLLEKKLSKKIKKSDKHEKLRMFMEKSHKRDEEKYKFVYRRVFEGLLKNFAKNHLKQKGKRKHNKSLYSLKLYEKYFGEFVNEKNPIEHFMMPKRDKKNLFPKTFDRGYFERLRKSEEFVNDFVREIEIQREKLDSQVSKKMNNFQKILIVKFLRKNSFGNLQSYLQQDKTKLPWSVVESDDAYEFFKTKLTLE